MEELKLNLEKLSLEIGLKEYLQTPFSIVGYELEKKEIELILEKKNIKIHNDIFILFQNFKKIEFSWYLSKDMGDFQLNKINDTDIIRGRFSIYSLNDILNGINGEGWKNVIWFDSMSEIKKNEMMQYFPFDMGLSEETVVLKCENGYIDNKLFLLSIYEDEIIDLNLDINSYMELLLQSKGFEFWLRAYRDRDSEQHKKFMHYIPQLFPNSDFPLINFQ